MSRFIYVDERQALRRKSHEASDANSQHQPHAIEESRFGRYVLGELLWHIRPVEDSVLIERFSMHPFRPGGCDDAGDARDDLHYVTTQKSERTLRARIVPLDRRRQVQKLRGLHAATQSCH